VYAAILNVYLNKGKVEQARKVLQKLRDTDKVDHEFREIENSVKDSKQFEQSSKSMFYLACDGNN
jgi:pentatricopeptide repeat protein